ncbi:ATP-binding protein [Pseudanabaena sp. PCC 6802]|uniref:ATP-binding protein n=1 Tax=Pseudanabaena sp. PCC 6802 TaxID=118173 RepID=UPI0003466363|nr:ATP-binding protein [Pseudanabaena sp. PCC 6802]
MAAHPAKPDRDNILIADDGTDSLKLLASVLTSKGYRVGKAITSNQLLREIEIDPPDLILLKTHIFGANGFEICQMLKSQETTRNIPIIFIGHADREAESVRAFEAGGVDYITKPYRVREVLARIQNQLKILKLQRQLQAGNAKLQNELIERQRLEERNRALVNAMPDIMFRHRIDGTYLDIQAREGVLLVPREKLIGTKLQETKALEGAKKGLLYYIRLAIEKDEMQIYEHDLQKPDGLHIYETRIVKSGVDEAVCIVRDVTESKLAQARLHLLERAVAASSNGIVISDASQPDMPVVYVNPRFESITGYSATEVIGRNCRFLQGSDTNQPTIAEIRAALSRGGECRVILRNYRKDGSMFWNQLSISPVTDATGKLTNYIGAISDMSDRISAEIALQQAKEKAEAANEAKSQFLANMSHELRTPLNAILGFAQVVAQDPSLPIESREHLGIISRSGEHLLDLINDVLEMAKIESGQITFNPSNFNLYRLLDGLEEMWRFKANTKGIRLIFAYNANLPKYIYTDEIKLRQTLLNLLGNAIKFTQTGSVTLRIDLSQPLTPISHPPSPILQFEVEDTGYGIAPEEIDTLFEPFMQTESGRRSQEGTGLGLSISRNFVRIMGGEMSVTSQLGKGTTFKFHIPTYLHDRSTDIFDSPPPETELTRDRRLLSLQALQAEISSMPYEWVHDLHKAAILADPNAIVGLIDRMAGVRDREPLALTLRTLVNEFRFDAIFELTQVP